MTLVAGVDPGGTTASLALAGLDGTIVCESKIATESYGGAQQVLERIADGILALASEADENPAALGIGLPGLVDMCAGTSRFLPNLPTNWVDVEVATTLSSLVGCPVEVINDARAATLGELRYGHGREASSLALFTLGTGIGGGIAIDGKLRLGPIGAAGALGHRA
nr:ROK family protein [Planctomycetota bacterium]